jgi:hypothetical protein
MLVVAQVALGVPQHQLAVMVALGVVIMAPVLQVLQIWVAVLLAVVLQVEMHLVVLVVQEL